MKNTHEKHFRFYFLKLNLIRTSINSRHAAALYFSVFVCFVSYKHIWHKFKIRTIEMQFFFVTSYLVANRAEQRFFGLFPKHQPNLYTKNMNIIPNLESKMGRRHISQYLMLLVKNSICLFPFRVDCQLLPVSIFFPVVLSIEPGSVIFRELCVVCSVDIWQ